MARSSETHRALARWLLTAELTGVDGPAAESVAATRVFNKLSARVANVITPVGSAALFRRAVHLSSGEYPFLDRIQTAPSTDSLIDWLCQAAATVEPSQAHASFVAVLGTLVALLDVFIGQRLTFRLLLEVWPELPLSHPAQSTRKNGTGKLEAKT